MRLTRKTNYALRALVLLAENGSADKEDLKTLARELGAPPAFLGKVLQALAKAGLVKGARGVHGGYSLARPAERIDIRSIVEAMEGGVQLSACSSGATKCSRGRTCGARDVWRRLQARINEALESETVASLAQRSLATTDRSS